MAKTVIVLGAGASCDCLFPTGIGLINDIIKFNGNWENVRQVKRILWNSRDQIISNSLKDSIPVEIRDRLISDDIKAYFELENDLFRRWIHLLPAFKSIDEFISFRKEYSLLAKICIVLVLSKSENPRFFDVRSDGIKRIWYHLFFGNLVKSARTIEEFDSVVESIHVISFNYDRSLEFFLRKSISAVFGVPVDEVKPFPITHVYGSTGSLRVSDGSMYHPYEPIAYNEDDARYRTSNGIKRVYSAPIPHNIDDFQKFDQYVLELSCRIETYGSEYDSEKKREVQRLIVDAGRVYFFGFAFHSQNVSVLFDNAAMGKKLGKRVDGTFYGLPKEYLRTVLSICAGHFKSGPPSSRGKEMTIQEFFENYSLRI